MPDVRRLPKSDKEWQGRIQEQRLEDTTLHGYAVVSSASEIKLDQFLLLRVIYNTPKEAIELVRHIDKWIGHEPYNNAKDRLDKQESWKSYLKYLEMHDKQSPNPGNSPVLGTFSLVFYYFSVVQGNLSHEFCRQKIENTPVAHRTRQAVANQASSFRQPEFFATPTRNNRGQSSAALGTSSFGVLTTPGTGSDGEPSTIGSLETLSPVSPAFGDDLTRFRAVEDEQIVNTALILFLNAITIHSQVKADWTLHRHRFLFGPPGKKVYEARVDGFLRQWKEAKSILEVKPCLREKKFDMIRMQESGQVAAWISEYPPANLEALRKRGDKSNRLLISQDGHQIWLSFARFDADYVDYVRGLNPRRTSLLEMQEYGPFETTDAKHMKNLGYILLAWTIQECK